MVNVVSTEEFAAYALTNDENERAQDTRMDGLAARVTELEAAPGAMQAPWVGTYVGELGNASPDFPALWRLRGREFAPRVWRCYDSTIKEDPSKARFHRIPSAIPFYSVKPNGDVAGFVNGDYEAAFKRLVADMPDDGYLAVWHEPEDDLGGDEFLELTEKVVADAKAANPNVRIAYASMAYQWETNSKGHTGSNAGWLEAAKLCDLVTTDVYASQQDFKPMFEDAGFVRWWNEIVVPSGRPWGVSERGVHDVVGNATPTHADEQRADMLLRDWADACRRGAEIFLYYDADWSGGNWLLDRPQELAAMGRIAAQGRAR